MARQHDCSQAPTHWSGSFRDLLRDAADENVELFAPIIAGARARGIADAFELAGVAALLIGGDGAVLHVGGHAKQFLGGALHVLCDHLVADDGEANRAVERMLASVLERDVLVQPLAIRINDSRAVCVRALPMMDGRGDPMQLLKAVLILTEASFF